MREQRRIISRLQATNPSSDNGLGDDNLDETVADASQLQLSNDFYHRLVSVNVSFFLFSFSFSFSFSSPHVFSTSLFTNLLIMPFLSTTYKSFS